MPQNNPEKILEYYKTIGKYHILAEQSHCDQIINTQLIQKFINTPDWILDIAGGTGYNAELLKISSTRYICIDLSISGLEIVSQKKRGYAVQAEASNLPLHDSSVDVVLCSWSLEHFIQPESVFEEMIRVLRPGGIIAIWGPAWDNVISCSFPQFAHKTKTEVRRIRWFLLKKIVENEFLPFRYNPFITHDVAAIKSPEKYICDDTDAVHCTLCQETIKYFKQKHFQILYVSDFSEWTRHIHNNFLNNTIRCILKPLLPLLRHVPILRWFVLRFPIIIKKPHLK